MLKKTLALAALLAATLTGSALADGQYALSIDAPSAKAKSKATATVKVTPKGKFHINKEFPTKLVLTAPDGVKVEKTKLTAGDAAKLDDNTLEFKVSYEASAPGKKAITGELKFALCAETSCDPQVAKISIDVDAK